MSAADNIREGFDVIKKRYEEHPSNVYNAEEFLKILSGLRQEVINQENMASFRFYSNATVQSICEIFEKYIDEDKKSIVQESLNDVEQAKDDFDALKTLEADILQYMVDITDQRNSKGHMFDSLFGDFDRSEVDKAAQTFADLFGFDDDKKEKENDNG